MKPLQYHEAAEDELLKEIAYLEHRAIGLGRRFFAEIQRTEKLIAQFPEAATELLPGIRRRILRNFPCSLIYTIEKDELLILAVAHHSRRLGYWVGRFSRTENAKESGA